MKPVLQALILAEHVYQDISGKKVIAGTFNRVRFSTKPLEIVEEKVDGTRTRRIPGGLHAGSPSAYVSLTEEESLENVREAVLGVIESHLDASEDIPWIDSASRDIPKCANQKWILVNA